MSGTVVPTVRVQEAPFDLAAESAALTRGRVDVGGLASFVGLCRADGRVIMQPQGGAAVTNGGTDRIQSYTSPGGGTAVIDGNTTTLFDPSGRVQTVPTPR